MFVGGAEWCCDTRTVMRMRHHILCKKGDQTICATIPWQYSGLIQRGVCSWVVFAIRCAEFLGPRRAPVGELSEFLSPHYSCAKANSPSISQNSRVCRRAQRVLSSPKALSKQYSVRFLYPLVLHCVCEKIIKRAVASGWRALRHVPTSLRKPAVSKLPVRHSFGRFLFNSTVKSPFCPVCPWDGGGSSLGRLSRKGRQKNVYVHVFYVYLFFSSPRSSNKSTDQIGKKCQKMSEYCVCSGFGTFFGYFFDIFGTFCRHSRLLGCATICPSRS